MLYITKYNNDLFTNYKDVYFHIKRTNLLKKKLIKIVKSKHITKGKKKKNKNKLVAVATKQLYKVYNKKLKTMNNQLLKNYHFNFSFLLRKFNKKYKSKYKRFLLGNSRLRNFGSDKDRFRYALKKVLTKVPFNRRFIFKRLPRLFFFWFIVLYTDLYIYLSKVILNNWFKFLYSTFSFNEYSKLFSSSAYLYNNIYNKKLIFIDNYFIYNNNFNNFLHPRLNYILGSFSYFFFNGVFFYDLKYINMSYRRHVNLYIRKSNFSKKNIQLKRFFVYKF